MLDKDFKTCLEENYFEYFSNTVGVFIEHAREMGLIGGSEGLGYKLENAVVANSINAHRFSHYAKEVLESYLYPQQVEDEFYAVQLVSVRAVPFSCLIENMWYLERNRKRIL
ncbi:hypothetical protein FM107_15320 [Sphingobacterium sp. JB170]|nr:hypothetical protein FM107_15320 [Sphingobacterium sp. JB170]